MARSGNERHTINVNILTLTLPNHTCQYKTDFDYLTRPWPEGAEPGLMRTAAETMTNVCVPALAKLAPEAGAYLNEVSVLETLESFLAGALFIFIY